MRSRTPDLSFEEQRAPGSTAKGFETTPFSTPAKLIDPQSSWGTDALPPSNVRMSQFHNSLVIIYLYRRCLYAPVDLVAFLISMGCEFCLYAFEVQLCLYLSNSFLKYATIFKIHCDSNIYNLFVCILTDCENVRDHNLCTVLKQYYVNPSFLFDFFYYLILCFYWHSRCLMLVVHQLKLQKPSWKHRPQPLYMSLRSGNSEL